LGEEFVGNETDLFSRVAYDACSRLVRVLVRHRGEYTACFA
jgi:hypothetical protein